MRRMIVAALLMLSTVGLLWVPAGANTNPLNKLMLSFDYSDNGAPASASNGPFNIIVDVLPEHTAGLVRMIAIAPGDSSRSNLYCNFQWVTASQVECGFNFTTGGVWTIRALYEAAPRIDITAVAHTNLRVFN